ncbi:TetR/AcrR family transcriptional regulator [Amycolatopsis suaedae]|uniref:TetR/AcrR family transcriptional regulator n=1 Tax=Amycolatopsis suaedae TaxID=2510978 RepID=A0A4Q7JA14_9PSEU|nr:TetR/AcrR family transcriptional regulator [Amycolatopsis suaedae]RZQ63293.1 TetR/AcrR family transcriptional regulator [Amycolatopsis suaedae]
MSRTYGGATREQRRAERREKLLLAALELFTSEGFAQTKITGLCARAGVSTRNFYEEFSGKEQLLLILHDRINQAAHDRVSAELAELSEAGPVARIAAALEVFVAAVTSDPRMPRLNYVEAVGVNQELERQHQEWVSRWADIIAAEAERAARHGLAPDRDYRLTAIALVGAATGLLREWQAHDPPLPVAEVAAELRALMLAGITRPVAGHAPGAG